LQQFAPALKIELSIEDWRNDILELLRAVVFEDANCLSTLCVYSMRSGRPWTTVSHVPQCSYELVWWGSLSRAVLRTVQYRYREGDVQHWYIMEIGLWRRYACWTTVLLA